MRHELTAETLTRLILWGLDQAMTGRPRPLRLRSAPAPDAPLVATLDYVAGFPCITVTPFAFYGESTAKLLQAVGRCLQSGKVDEVECCLLHALEPGRGLVLAIFAQPLKKVKFATLSAGFRFCRISERLCG